jgi:hypothetical protein
MNNVGAIKTAVKAYLQTNFPGSQMSPLGSSGAAATDAAVDSLVMLAINNARKFAELRHDWRCAEVRVRATIPAGGKVSLTGVEDFWDDTVSYDLKGLSSSYITNSEGGLLPLKIVTAKGARLRKRDVMDAREMTDLSDRYRGDDTTTYYDSAQLVVFGDYLLLSRSLTEDKEIVLEGFRWLDDYTQDNDEDFFTKRGTAFLLFSSLCEANLLAKTFVQRQEGSVAPPTRERDENLQVLIDADSWSIDGAIDHDLS